jgi:hypothetical protein
MTRLLVTSVTVPLAATVADSPPHGNVVTIMIRRPSGDSHAGD